MISVRLFFSQRNNTPAVERLLPGDSSRPWLHKSTDVYNDIDLSDVNIESAVAVNGIGFQDIITIEMPRTLLFRTDNQELRRRQNRYWERIMEWVNLYSDMYVVHVSGDRNEFFRIFENLEGDEAESDEESDEESDAPFVPAQLVQENLKKRALELDEEEEARKRSRRGSDPYVQKCTLRNDENVCKYKPLISGDWCEVEENHWYGPDSQNRCFDLEELLREFERQLTEEKYGNPYPQYPHDPFSRIPFALAELKELISMSRDAQISVDSMAPTLVRFVNWAPVSIDGKPFDAESRDQVIDNVVQMRGGSIMQSILKLFG